MVLNLPMKSQLLITEINQNWGCILYLIAQALISPQYTLKTAKCLSKLFCIKTKLIHNPCLRSAISGGNWKKP